MIHSILIDMLSWAREAGAVQLQYFRGNDLGISNKLNDSDIVTNADKASERLIIDHIHESYPEHSIYSEESGDDHIQARFRWVIDPLDGTTNFSAGLPIFSVSIALQLDGETVAAVVFNPYLDELFHAVKGEGAWLNGTPIRVSGKERISQAVVSTGFPVDKDTNPDNNLDNFSNIFTHVRGIRRLGSAAIDISYCAAGFIDAFWELNLHEWDVAAAQLILTEAGGKWTLFRTDRNVCIVAGTPAIHDFILPRLSTQPRL